uniref:Uncharacterized protein n=1 Tax=Cacopsylla melanoneura TaxID=428564 RepID=A0A8D8TIJ9_9HEMI
MDPFDHNFDQPIGSAPSNDNTHKDDYNDFFLQKPSKINTTIDFLNAETGAGHQVTSSGLENLLSGAGDELTKSVDSLVDNVSNKVHAEVTSGTDKVSEKAHEIVETVDKKLEDNDLLGLSTSALSPKEPTLEPIKQEEMHKSSALDHVKDVLFDDKEQDKQEVMHRPSAPDHVKDLLFDEKEQDELKGFDQYTSDSNASLKVNLSCENDDTASTKSIDSAQSIPLDEKKILAKENLIDDAPEVLSRITEDTLVSSESPKFSSPSPKESKSFVDNYENEFVSQEAPLDYIYESTPKVEHVAPPKPVGEKEVPKVVEKKEEKVSKPEPEVAKVKAPPVKKAPSTEMFIGPHEIFSRFGLDTWFNPEKLNPEVESLHVGRCETVIFRI